LKTGYLGPVGTFSQQAALYFAKKEETHPFSSITDVLKAVEEGLVEQGVVPLENSIEGTVNATMDGLIFDSKLFIHAELPLPVTHCLMVRHENLGKNITRILSHPQALGQCRKYLESNYRDIETVAVSSTAEAARLAAQTSECYAAICTSLAASLYGLEIIDTGIEDCKENYTHFLLVSAKDSSQPKAGYKVTLAFATANTPGALFKTLNIFSIWDLNMTKILSRPMKTRTEALAGEYVFYIDIEGFESPRDVEEALLIAKRKSSFFKPLGSYKVLEFKS